MARTKIDRRIIKTKRALTTSLLQLMADKSIDEVTITELTQLADVNRKTFYLHYTCIADVASEINNRLSAEFIKAVASAKTETGFVPEKLFKALQQAIDEDSEFFKAFCTKNASAYFLRLAEPMMFEQLTSGLQTAYPNADETLLHDTLVFVIAGCISLFFNWIRAQDERPLSEVMAVATKLSETELSALR